MKWSDISVLVCSLLLISLTGVLDIGAKEECASPEPLIPWQDFTAVDAERFPSDLLKEIKKQEQEWGKMLLKHRKQYEDYYRDILGPDIHNTWDVYNKEIELMNDSIYRKCNDPVQAKKTLVRFPDRVWISAKNFKKLYGKKIDRLRLIGYRFGRFQMIPFDIDEGTGKGEKVFKNGPKNNASDGDNRFTHTDQLTFFAHDCGDKIDVSLIKQQFGKKAVSEEIELIDPVTGAKGWVYLTFFPKKPPPKSEFDYITFLNDTVNQQFSDYIWHQSTFRFIGNKIYRKIFCRSWKYAPFFKYDGEEMVDRLKIRVTARLCFGLLKLGFNEDRVIGDWLAWNDGQALATGRGWIAVQLPLGLKSPHFIFDVIAAETVLSVPLDVVVPINPGNILTDYTMKIGTDWHRGHYKPGDEPGFRFYNSNNRDGVVVDGIMSERENNWNQEKDEWRILTGPAGTVAFRSYWDPYYANQANIRVEYVDDVNKPDPPEFHPGQVAMHYSVSHVESLEPRTYTILLEWYGPPDFWDKDPKKNRWDLFKQYLEMLDHPLEFKVGDQSDVNWIPDLRFPRK